MTDCKNCGHPEQEHCGDGCSVTHNHIIENNSEWVCNCGGFEI